MEQVLNVLTHLVVIVSLPVVMFVLLEITLQAREDRLARKKRKESNNG